MFPVGKIKIRILIAGRLNKQRDEGMIKTEIRGQRSEVGKRQKDINSWEIE